MAAKAAVSSWGAAACTAEDEVSTAAGSASSAASAPGTPVAAAKARAAGGRTRGAKKPQIDIDDEIVEANQLAELFKKMQKASKVAARSAGRQRQRLVRKAQKLSEQDLMRLAVIKRCGMFVPDETVLPASASGADGGPPVAKKSKAQEHISSRFKTLVTGVSGAAELCEALNIRTEGNTTARGAMAGSPVSAVVAKPLDRPRGPVLQRLPSGAPKKAAVVAAAAAAHEGDGEEHETDHEVGTAEADGSRRVKFLRVIVWSVAVDRLDQAGQRNGGLVD